jgi:hypothetical protein
MAEFQWWLLIVGLLAGGGLVAVVSMDGRRREEDIVGLERRAEATWIATRLSGLDRELDPGLVEAVLREHREYLAPPPPDRIVVAGELDGDPDRPADEVRDGGRGRADDDLAHARIEQAPTRQEAHAGPDREQRTE